VDHLSLMREWLDKQRIVYQYLDGATPAKKRQAAVSAFQGGRGDLFLISLKAGGAGLNLTAADYVIHLDPWWNPAAEDQASDRAHRIGQQRPVTIYRLVARDTIEDRILDLHRYKRDLADSLLEGAEMSARMGVEEMMALLKDVG
jgi:SNF2 family DNA or RNA helicase